MTTYLENETITHPVALKNERFRGRTTLAFNSRPGGHNLIENCLFEGYDRTPGRGGSYALYVPDGKQPFTTVRGCELTNADKAFFGDAVKFDGCHVHSTADGYFWRHGKVLITGQRDGQGRSNSVIGPFDNWPGDHSDPLQGAHGGNVRMENTDIKATKANSGFFLESYDGQMDNVAIVKCDIDCENYTGYVWLQEYRYKTVLGVQRRVDATFGPPTNVRILGNKAHGTFGKAAIAVYPGTARLQGGVNQFGRRYPAATPRIQGNDWQ